MSESNATLVCGEATPEPTLPPAPASPEDEALGSAPECNDESGAVATALRGSDRQTDTLSGLEDITRVLAESLGEEDELTQLRRVAREWARLVNHGSIGYSVMVYDALCDALDRSDLEPSLRREVLDDAIQELSMESLGHAAAHSHTRVHLKELLGRLPCFRVDRLLAELRREPSRARRRFLLEILQVHGDATRDQALQQLHSRRHPWYFRRNLVFLLRKAAGSAPRTREELLAVAAELEAETAQQRREALRYLGEDPRPAANAALVRALERLEPTNEEERLLVLEQLAGQSCANARGVAVEQLLKCRRLSKEHLRLLRIVGSRDLPRDTTQALLREARKLLLTLRFGRLAGVARQVRLEGVLLALASSSKDGVDDFFEGLRDRELPAGAGLALQEALVRRARDRVAADEA